MSNQPAFAPPLGALEATTVESFLTAVGSEAQRLENGKVRCVISGTDMPARLELLKAFWNGRVYRQTKKKLEEEQHGPLDLSKYAPHIIEHKRLDNKVYCRRTKRILNKERGEIERHMAGRRFLFAMKSYKPRPAPDAPKEASIKSGNDDVWSRMPGALAEGGDSDAELDPDASEDEEEHIAAAIARQMPGQLGDDDEDEEGEDGEEEDAEGAEEEEDDGEFEEVPMEDEVEEESAEDEEEEGEEEEEEEEEAPAPPAKKAKTSASTAASKKSAPPAPPAAKPAKAAKAAAAAAAPRPTPAPAKKQVMDNKPIGPPSKRDLKKMAKKGIAPPAADTVEQKKQQKAKQPSGAEDAPPARLSISERRKMKKQAQKQKQAATADTANGDKPAAKAAPTAAKPKEKPAAEPKPAAKPKAASSKKKAATPAGQKRKRM